LLPSISDVLFLAESTPFEVTCLELRQKLGTVTGAIVILSACSATLVHIHVANRISRASLAAESRS
jgi:hypothetical protein